MIWLDLILVTVLIGFLSWGSYTGFVHAVASFIGLVASVFVSLTAHGWLLQTIPSLAQSFWGQVLSFFFLLVVITKVIGMLVELVNKVFRIVSIIPFTKTLNRFLGALLGGLIGIIFIGSLLFVAASVPELPQGIEELLRGSRIARISLTLFTVLGFLFPEAVDRARALFLTT